MFTIMRAIVTIVIIVLTGSAVTYATAGQEMPARDSAPISGYVIQPEGDEFLIDLDARQQIAVGDLFSVVRVGEKLTHPVTGELLGTHDSVKGVLKVTRIKTGYSVCLPVGAHSGIQRGDVIRRIQQINAPSQTAVPLPLPVPASSSVPAPAPLPLPLPSSVTAPAPVPAPLPAVSTLPDAAPAAGGILVNRTVENVAGSLWTSLPFTGTPVGVEVGDFDGDGLQEIAVAFFDRVEIGRLKNGTYQHLAAIKIGVGTRSYALDAVDLNNDGRPELYVSAATAGSSLVGVVIEPIDGMYRITRKDIPWHMRRMTLPGEGVVLLGQKFGSRGKVFGGPIFRIQSRDGKLIEGPTYEVPKKVNLYDLTPLAAVGGRKLLAVIGDDNYLNIVTAEGEQLGSSAEAVGGSEAYIEMNDFVPNGGEGQLVYVKARVEQNDKGEIIVPVNSGFSALSRVKIYTKSYLKALTWDGSALREAWRSAPEKSCLTDYRFADAGNEGKKNLVTIVAFPDTDFFEARKSVLHLYPLP